MHRTVVGCPAEASPSLVLEPQPDCDDVCLRSTEAFSELLRCEPLMIVGGTAVLLGSEELVESELLLGSPPKLEHYSV